MKNFLAIIFDGFENYIAPCKGIFCCDIVHLNSRFGHVWCA